MYIDYDLMRKYPNKYNLTPENIKNLKILDWKKLKKKTWFNKAMKDSGNWWCHLEGCNYGGKYDDEDEFWIGFNEDNNKIDCRWTSYGGMCHYIFNEFYNIRDIENKFDMNVQANSLRWLNKMIEEGILGI
jgi:hypothetical protein